MKKKGYAKGGMKKKGYAKGGMAKKKKGYAMGGIQTSTGSKYEPSSNRAAQGMMSGRGMASGMGMAKGGMPKKKAYAKGGKVAMYNQGGMVKNTSTLNTGLKKGK